MIEFKCSNTSIVTPPKELPVMRAEFIRYDWFTGKITFDKIKPVTLSMVTGFFDTGLHTNCSLTNFTLTKVKNLLGEEVPNTTWTKFFAYDQATKVLTLDNYAVENVSEIADVSLVFQSEIVTGVFSE